MEGVIGKLAILASRKQLILCTGSQGVAEDEAEVSPKKTKAPVQLETDEDGHPLLPSNDSRWPLEHLKSVVRAYVTAVYRWTTGRPRDAVPWKKLAESPESCLDIIQTVLPESVSLRDPSKMQKQELLQLLNCWSSEVEAERRPLVFQLTSARRSTGAREREGKGERERKGENAIRGGR